MNFAPPRPPLFDTRQVRRAFGRAAHGYDAASPLQREIESRLLESLDHWALRHRDEVPQVIVDVACGPARAAACAGRVSGLAHRAYGWKGQNSGISALHSSQVRMFIGMPRRAKSAKR